MSGKKNIDLNQIPCNSSFCPIKNVIKTVEDIKEIQQNDIKEFKKTQKDMYDLLIQIQVLITKFDNIQNDIKEIGQKISILENIQREDIIQIHKKIERKDEKTNERIDSLHKNFDDKCENIDRLIDDKVGKKDIILISTVIGLILTTVSILGNAIMKFFGG